MNSRKKPIIRILISISLGVLLGYIFFNNPKNIALNEKEYKGTICLIIDDYGFAFNNLVKDFLLLDTSITAAIIPSTPYSKNISEFAKKNNVETIIHMPMESYDQDNEYIIELNEKLNSTLVEDRIKYAFNELPYALGMNNHQGSKATLNLQLMKNVARTLKKMNKFFLDSFTNPESRGFITMRRYGVPTQLRQVFLDHDDNYESIKSNLDSLVALSHNMEVAIGIGHIKQYTYEVLKNEIPKLKLDGYRFIKLSKAVN